MSTGVNIEMGFKLTRFGKLLPTLCTLVRFLSSMNSYVPAKWCCKLWCCTFWWWIISLWNMKSPELWKEYLFSCCGVWNFFPQLSQVWFRMSMCEKRSCRNLWPVLLNCFPHKEHICFPLFISLFRWFLQCLLRSSLRMKLLPHSSHVYGLWFKCRYLSWTSNAVELEKT